MENCYLKRVFGNLAYFHLEDWRNFIWKIDRNNLLIREIGTNNFRKLFSAILTDRDTVFDDFTSFEFNSNRILRTKIFFCNPGESNQKTDVENFNAQLRAIFPKHSLLDSYTQNDLYFAASNLNSRHLNSIDDKTPADLFIEVFGIELFEALHLKKIKGDEVKLKPIHS